MFGSPFTEVFEFTFQTLLVFLFCLCCSLRVGGLAVVWAVRKAGVGSRVCGLGGLIPQECSGMWDQKQASPGMLLSIHQTLAGCGCLSWCCLDEPRSPQSQMVPFVFTILAHFCSFSLPSLHESASTRTEVSTSSFFPKFPSFLQCWAAELKSPGVCMGLGWCG